jgi:predicted secreted hydrolase
MRAHRPALSLSKGGILVLVALACGGEEHRELGARLTVAETLGGESGEGYAQAAAGRELVFPADHGPHPDFRTEWWYFTGNLATAEGRRFGYQLTFFRTAVAPPGGDGEQIDEGEAGVDGAEEPERQRSAWATRQVYMAHFAVTDVAGKRFAADERFSRGALGLAGARIEPFQVWVESWRVAAVPSGSRGGSGTRNEDSPTTDSIPFADPFAAHREVGVLPLQLTAEGDEASLDLLLGAGKDRVLHGEDGFSRKGPGAGNASYYYSYPRLPTRGTLTVEGETFRVEGASWLDREWSSSVLAAGQTGWDWFALQLDDGREVVAWRIRGGGESAGLDYAALVSADAELRVLDLAGARLEATGRWTSPQSGVVYPSGWRLRLPAAGLDLDVAPLLADQELDLAFRYWEGAVAVRGTAGGRPLAGRGYAELTGYGDAAASLR